MKARVLKKRNPIKYARYKGGSASFVVALTGKKSSFSGIYLHEGRVVEAEKGATFQVGHYSDGWSYGANSNWELLENYSPKNP